MPDDQTVVDPNLITGVCPLCYELLQVKRQSGAVKPDHALELKQLEADARQLVAGLSTCVLQHLSQAHATRQGNQIVAGPVVDMSAASGLLLEYVSLHWIATEDPRVKSRKAELRDRLTEIIEHPEPDLESDG